MPANSIVASAISAVGTSHRFVRMASFRHAEGTGCRSEITWPRRKILEGRKLCECRE